MNSVHFSFISITIIFSLTHSDNEKLEGDIQYHDQPPYVFSSLLSWDHSVGCECHFMIRLFLHCGLFQDVVFKDLTLALTVNHMAHDFCFIVVYLQLLLAIALMVP